MNIGEPTMIVLVWAGLVGLSMILYVLLDGITLGVGLLFPLTTDEKERSRMINSVAPVWDVNETWLVFGGAAIFVAFPLVYSILSSALYVPLMTFIMGLIFRGVTIEFRAEAVNKERWDRAFFWGSLIAVLSQGFMLGGILTGITIRGNEFAGAPMDWINPFSIMVGIALIPGYVMLASCYLIIKTDGTLQARAYRHAFWSTLWVLFFMAIVTIWTPYHYPLVWKHWFAPPRIYFVWSFPLLGLVATAWLLRSLKARSEAMPLACAVALFLSGYLGLMTSLYPYAIPPSITLAAAAGQRETLIFALWGAAIVLPLVIAYFIYTYVVFRGKTAAENYYGH
jgi:cytochrome bd ubiquinol oxidase subunit II